MTLGDWLTSHGIVYSQGSLTVGEEQAVVDPALRVAIGSSYTGGGEYSTADKMDLAREYWGTSINGGPLFGGGPLTRADVVRAGDEWGYIGALRGFDTGPASGVRIPGVGPVVSSIAGTDALSPASMSVFDGEDRQMIAGYAIDTPMDVAASNAGSQSLADILRNVGGAVADVFLPGAGTIIRGFGQDRVDTPFSVLGAQQPRPQLPAPRLPMPGGGAPTPTPRPPTTGGRPSFKFSPYINPKTGKNIPWSKIAKIGAAAAALGISVEEYIRRFGVPRKHPTMNPLNPRALRRAMGRVDRFGCFVRGAVQMQRTMPRLKRKSGRKCKPRKCA